jgi:acyl-CoA synthetase (AMP-forming)/AMP-acid ligase II
MGFLHAGELYVTGRRKEMFIINGQNYYAHDFESLAQEVAGVSVNGVMAVKVLNGESESVVMILEARAADDGAAPAMVAGIREIVSLTLGISLLDVFVVKRGLLPKTSSGKLERHQGSSFYADVSGKYLSLR